MLTTLHTNGSGLWSSRSKDVNVTKLKLGYEDDLGEFGELRVYFDDSWDVESDGLIYTDKLFEKELQAWLKAQGYSSSGVSYSEAGMQGDHYVSLDVDRKFLKSWYKKLN